MATLQIQDVKVSAEMRGALAIFIVSTAPVLVAWIWCFLAWHILPDVSLGTDEQQRWMLYVATELPHTIVGVVALLIGIAGTIYLAVKRRALLFIAFIMYQLPVQAAIFVASISFINFKPPDW